GGARSGDGDAEARRRRPRPLEPRRRRPGTGRSNPPLRRRAAGSHPDRAGRSCARDVPRRELARRRRWRAGTARARILARLCARQDLLRELHGARRRLDEGRPLPLRERPRAAREREGDPQGRAALLEPQRGEPRVRAGREAVGRPGRRRFGRRSGEPRAESGRLARKAVPARRATGEAHARARRDRPAQPMAIQLRPRHGRSLDRRRRAGRDRGDRPAAARDDRARQLRLERLRGPQPLLRRNARARDADPADRAVHPCRGLLRHRRVRLSRQRGAPPEGPLCLRRLLQRDDLEHRGARRRASPRAGEGRPADVFRGEPERRDALRGLRRGHDLPLRTVTPVCATCGAWFPDVDDPPPACPICEDDRQWVPADGQRWTTPGQVVDGRSSDVREHEPGLTGIGLAPSFAIGQRMLLVETDSGNVLWDMIPAAGDEAVAAVRERGGARAIAISHPHYYGAASAWSEALGGVPVLLHAADAEWVTRPDAAIDHWEGDVRELPGGLRLLRLGGHFPGATVLHWPGGADGRGALLSGDVVMALPDRNVSFMWSYPNLVPLPAGEVERIGTALRGDLPL